MAQSYMPDPAIHRAGIQNLRDEMARHHLSPQGLADLSGVSRSMISAILGGTKLGGPRSQNVIARALGVDPGLIFPRAPIELERAETFYRRCSA